MTNDTKNLEMLTAADAITWAHEAVNPERVPCEIAGYGNRSFALYIPLAAAVELELAGYSIKVTGPAL